VLTPEVLLVHGASVKVAGTMDRCIGFGMNCFIYSVVCRNFTITKIAFLEIPEFKFWTFEVGN
jgi:hypothetical protein